MSKNFGCHIRIYTFEERFVKHNKMDLLQSQALILIYGPEVHLEFGIGDQRWLKTKTTDFLPYSNNTFSQQGIYIIHYRVIP